jgi:hypothetical protein
LYIHYKRIQQKDSTKAFNKGFNMKDTEEQTIWYLGLFPITANKDTAQALINRTKVDDYTTPIKKWVPWNQDNGLRQLRDLLGGHADMWENMMMFLDPLIEMDYYAEEFNQEAFIAVLNEHDLLMTSIITRWITAYSAETGDKKLAEKVWLLILKMNHATREHYDLIGRRPVVPFSALVTGEDEKEEEEVANSEVTFVNLSASKLVH